MKVAECDILAYVPNKIGYGRLVCFLIGTVFIDYNPTIFLFFYLVSTILDGFDGYYARKLNQVSAFGAWLDVVIDNLERGFLWCYLSKFGYFISALEWITFACTHNQGPKWKESYRSASNPMPHVVRILSKDGFSSTVGRFVLSSLHLLPCWLYCWKWNYLPFPINFIGFIIFLVGRLLAALVEIWTVYSHLRFLLIMETTS